MGQKINPTGFRVGPLYPWRSRWFADPAHYSETLLEDVRLRDALHKKLKSAGLAQVVIERSINKMGLTLHVSRPGVVIGRGGSGLEETKKYIESFLAKHRALRAIHTPYRSKKSDMGKLKVEVTVEPVKEPNLNAFLIATNIGDQLCRRLPQKRVCNQALERIMSAGAKGARVLLSGRIGGAEIARREKYQQGTVPLSTIREDVDYAQVPALTKSGYVGVKVWICRGSK